MGIRITALGAAREVGRSAILIEDDKRSILLDCGIKILHGEDRYATPVGLEKIAPRLDAVILSHAHLDHSGYIPALYHMGFSGKIYATPPTKDVTEILRRDMLKIMSIEMQRGLEPLWSRSEMYRALEDFEVYPYEEEFEVAGVKVKFYDAGHTLGSAQILLDRDGLRILYTGDIKPEPTEFFDGAVEPKEKVDIVISEATNGSEEVPKREEVKKALEEAVEDTFMRRGKILIPAFAFGRSQEVVASLVERRVPAYIYMDGLGTKINEIFRKYRNENRFSPEALRKFRRPPMDRSDVIEVRNMRGSGIDPLKYRKLIVGFSKPIVIVSTNGMLEGGPILSYLELMSSDSRSLLAFSGYQVEGTLGRKILDGARSVTIRRPNGEEISININMRVDYFRLSGHARREDLIRYIKTLSPSRVFFVHGDSESIDSMSEELGGEALEINKTISLS